ncbi:type IV pilus modification protein PilV [Endozoicomonas sp. SM1973]|uniref:Type IV pilus modification protein PilV n=1 Tax=Spartinivicinus marinus TaxID=2994442 RepID=A0A853IGA8_9GAMM|nr:type IV pilus modification protein PilV [Spartinivicinus marinus]MCX4026044.1 type IV pilus modification protein PilV [Spartinivicinus marinus]NYZ69021.1 type IV pilus modification protein PilV [Spartinivicinus marinus]
MKKSGGDRVLNKKKFHSSVTLNLQQGVGLIEILISILVLSIGLLGLAGLQAVGLKNNSQSFDRSYAVFLASNILDRIRANPTADYTTEVNDEPSITANKCEKSSCDVSVLRDYDLSQWKCLLGHFNQHANCSTLKFGGDEQDAQVQGLLNDGTGSIIRNGSRYIITIEWSSPTKIDPNNRSSYNMVTDI